MKKLTGRQAEILKFISQFIRDNGYSPSVQDIMKFFGFKSPNSVTCHIKSLISKGYLVKGLNKARSLKIKFSPVFSGIPVIGKIAAGKPVIVEDFSDDFLFSPGEMEDVFALRVKGDSMEQAHIYDGDYVLVRKNVGFNNGDIVAAVVGEEATIKYFRKIEDKIFLIPANPSYQAVEIKENCIVGKVIGVFRKV